MLGAFWALFFLTACGGSRWYNPGHSQADFNYDASACKVFAQRYAKDYTVSGCKRNVELYRQAYTRCLFNKGWSHVPPDQQQAKDSETSRFPETRLGMYKNGVMQAFDYRFVLSADAQLTKSQVGVQGPARQRTWIFQLSEGGYFNCTVQHSLGLPFKQTGYPLPPGYHVFDRDRATLENGTLNWLLFCGPRSQTWVGGWGAYLVADKYHRIILTMTRVLPPQRSQPPAGLRLTKNQYKSMEKLSTQMQGMLADIPRKAKKLNINISDFLNIF